MTAVKMVNRFLVAVGARPWVGPVQIALLFSLLIGCSDGESHLVSKNFDFDSLKYERYFWSGKHKVPWLSSTTSFLVDAKETGISEEQREAISFVYSLPRSTKKRVELYLFNYYQNDVFGSLSGGEKATPKIASPDKIWKIVSKPGIDIPPDRKLSSECYFVLNLECVWDSEHGLALLFDRDAIPLDIGGQGKFF